MKMLIETQKGAGLKQQHFRSPVKIIIPVLLEDDKPALLHVNFTDEGIIMDLVDKGSVIGTSSQMYDDAVSELMFLGDDFCKKCNSPLDEHGRCTDETCPYSDREQNETFTEG